MKVEFSAPREIEARVPQGSVLALVLYSLHTDDASVAPRTHLALLVDNTCMYTTEKHERRVLCKLQRGLTAVNSRCERWNIKINEVKTQAIYFSRSLRVLDVLQRNGRSIPFLNNNVSWCHF
jgi:hypothetical protein